MTINIDIYGMLVGLVGGTGLVLFIFGLPFWRRQKLDDRLAPYVRDSIMVADGETSDRVFTPFPTLERILRPYLGRGARTLERSLGSGQIVRKRIRQAGLQMTLEEFRIEQLIWGAMFFGTALLVSFALLVSMGFSAVGMLALSVAAFLMGILMRDRVLSTQVKKRETRMMEEFPTVADMLALSVTAGEGPVAALERVSTVSKGELAKEFRLAISEAQTGSSLIEALEAVGDRTNLPLLARFVDGIAVSVERGTPLADVLKAQAADVRDAGRRNLVEIGGKKEIGMMVPVIFLVLPVTILFALFPATVSFRVIS